MILLDGIEYEVNTPEENANNAVRVINQYCSANNIVNRHGELIQIEQNYTSPLYMMLYGLGYLITACQRLLYSAGCALSIPAASERQLMNIADMANVKRRDPTKTTITCSVFSNLSSDDAVECKITTALSVTFPTGNGDVVFHPAFDITIPVAESRNVILVAETLGSYVISAQPDLHFDEDPEGFRKMIAQASYPGQDQESIADLRRRLQDRGSSGTRSDLCSIAMNQLDGVSAASIYFNQSGVDDQVVNGVSVPPRQALLFVQGYSPRIAETYFSYLDCQCAGKNAPNAIEQIYTTRAGQELPVYIIPPEQVVVFIRLYFNEDVDDVTAQAMRDTISTLAVKMSIGQTLTSTQVVDVLQENGYTHPAGCQLSLNNEVYTYQVKADTYQLITFAVDVTHIQIMVVS